MIAMFLLATALEKSEDMNIYTETTVEALKARPPGKRAWQTKLASDMGSLF